MTEVTLSMKGKSDVSDKFDLSEALSPRFFKSRLDFTINISIQ